MITSTTTITLSNITNLDELKNKLKQYEGKSMTCMYSSGYPNERGIGECPFNINECEQLDAKTIGWRYVGGLTTHILHIFIII